MCFHGASLQCSCPSYRAAEWETLVGPGGAGRRKGGGLFMVDWMVLVVRPEAEDFDWRTVKTGGPLPCRSFSYYSVLLGSSGRSFSPHKQNL